MYWNTHAKQSWIDRCFRNPYWFLCMHLRITFCRRLASNLVRNLRQVLVKEIGWKSLGPTGANILGMRVMKEEFMFCKLILPSKQSLTNCLKSFSIIVQHFLTNIPLNPSGRGARLVGRSLSTAEISSSEKGASNSSRPKTGAIREERSKPMEIPCAWPILDLKEFHKIPAIWSWSLTTEPSSLYNEEIVFRLSLSEAIAWKNLEFSSPTMIYLMVHLCFQYIWCSFSTRSYWSLTLFLKLNSGLVRGLSSSRLSKYKTTYEHLVANLFKEERLVLHFLSASLNLLNLTDKVVGADKPIATGSSQEVLTQSRKPGISTQKFSKRKIFDFGIVVSIDTTQGTWSEEVLAKGNTTIFG